MENFNKLTVKEQRLKIVEDAITQIRKQLFRPTRGKYLTFGEAVRNEESLKDIMEQEHVVCECCAIGAIFAACVLSVNEVYGRDDYNDGDFESKKLEKWFEAEQLDLIEFAFEGLPVRDTNHKLVNPGAALVDRTPYTEIGNKARAFFLKYCDDKKRMLAILNNILENDGEFKL